MGFELSRVHVANQIQPGIDVANIVAVAFLLAAFVISYKEYRRDKRRTQDEKERDIRINELDKQISRESSAKSLYNDYLKLCLKFPDLSMGKYRKGDDVDEDRYDTFVSIMLSAFDEAINYTEGDYYFQILRDQLFRHGEYIRPLLHKDVPDADNYRGIYSTKFLALVDRAYNEIDVNIEKSATTSPSGS